LFEDAVHDVTHAFLAFESVALQAVRASCVGFSPECGFLCVLSHCRLTLRILYFL
jgi:hypothetical protein